MVEKAGKKAKMLIWRRIAVKGVVFAIWVIGMLTIVLQGGQELSQSTYFYMLFAIVLAWATSTAHDVCRLRRASVDD